jgi:hypothetical protein
MGKETDDGQVIKFTKAELHAAITEHVKPLEKAAFEAGKREGLAEANELVRLEAMTKIARQAGLISTTSGAPAAAAQKTPEQLAKRAHELQVEALRNGRELSNIESVKAAYLEAGIPLK